jgi:predicted transposase YbfD/YdcC
MVPFSRLLGALSEVPDPRRAEGKRYPLAPLLLFTVLALLSGATSYRRIICFLEQRREVLTELFGVTLRRAPSVNTLRTVLQELDGDALERAFRRHAEGLLARTEGETPVIALDGKTLKGSFDHLNDRKAAQALSAFASEAAILLAHSEIDDKSNEIPAAQRMIQELGLNGVLFTADALHCQKTFEAARDIGNALLAQVKANQPTLLATLEGIAATQAAADSVESVDPRSHGRHETRTVDTFDVRGKLDPEWDGLIVQAARVARLTWHKDTRPGLWHATEEVSFYACQVALSAEAFAQAVRGHWAIENRSHYVRDVTFGEDASRTRIKPTHFARFRSFAINILRANGVTNVARELYVNALNFNNVLAYRLS